MHNANRQYIDHLDPASREKLEILNAMILEICPEAVQSMKYNIPTYEFGKQWIAIAGRKQHISVYAKDRNLIINCTREHPEINAGKSLTCVFETHKPSNISF